GIGGDGQARLARALTQPSCRPRNLTKRARYRPVIGKSLGGGKGLAALSLKELDAKIRFKRLHLVADGGLPHVPFLSRLREAAEAHAGLEDANGFHRWQIAHRRLSPSPPPILTPGHRKK